MVSNFASAWTSTLVVVASLISCKKVTSFSINHVPNIFPRPKSQDMTSWISVHRSQHPLERRRAINNGKTNYYFGHGSSSLNSALSASTSSFDKNDNENSQITKKEIPSIATSVASTTNHSERVNPGELGEKEKDSSTTNINKTPDKTPSIKPTPLPDVDILYSTGNNSTTSIQGLLPNPSFDRSCRRHCTLTLLRKHFPTLLELPALSQSTAQLIYDADAITVTGPRGEQLAEGLEEVVGVTRALAVAATAARRAGSLLDFAVGGGGGGRSNRSASTSSSSSSSDSPPMQGVECELLVDPQNPFKVMVLWRTRLPAIGVIPAAASSPFGSPQSKNKNQQSTTSSSSSSQYTEFSGKSLLDISPDTGLVTNLQIQKVKINGVPIVESIGTALAAVRAAARSAMASSSIFETMMEERSSSGNPFLDGILNGIQREFSAVVEAVDALPLSSENTGISGSSMYVLPESCWEKAIFPVEEASLVDSSTLEDTNTTVIMDGVDQSSGNSICTPVPIDQYSQHSSDIIPLVGSEAFVNYAMIHQSLINFEKYGLPRLAGTDAQDSLQATNTKDGGDSTEGVRSLFTTDVNLVTLGGDDNNANYISLLRGAGKVADFYRTLSLFRNASGGDWTITKLEGDWKTRTLLVSWRAESPLKIEGTDAFIFEVPKLSSLADRLPIVIDGDKDEIATLCRNFFNPSREISDNGDKNGIPLKIDRIETLQLTVGGATADSEWAKSFVSAALRTGLMENSPLPDPTIAELLRALTAKRTPASKKSPPKKDTAAASTMPYLEDAAAVSFYGILRALHRDISNIGNTESPSSSSPAMEFLADTIELRGLLGEVLTRGNKSYNRLLGVAISSLRAAIQTNRVRLAAPPRPTIEITPKGSIKVNFFLALWIDAPTFPLGVSAGRSSNDSNNGGFGVPLKIEVVSEYIIDGAGKIREHRINESRLNGILTPGDVFSRWIKGLAGSSPDQDGGIDVNTIKGAPSAFESLVDAISWVRSMQDRK